MDDCCLDSFARKGLAEAFTLTPEGGGHTCDGCGQYYQIVRGRWHAAYKCPRCGAVSFHPTDRQERYCGRCHAFEGEHVVG